ncbi:histone-lysine N-methyltransferase SETMAR [Trichonephila clavata]|uniref:Histone-lysine N-methyltransferase SETMAR n=1 Tax=Trichonephila clavata TaxID=2740835 RepID=A0A8X6GJT8_TRICU|nr:histone-lysine N-methyltransferase SETMAR [Trichonephila clavata]
MTSWTLSTLELDLMQHPPYILDMTSSDYYLFSHLQLHLDGTISHSNNDVINEVDCFLDLRMPQFIEEGIKKLLKRRKTVGDLIGDYYYH